MMLGDFPIRGAVREKKRKLATLSVMISVWIVEIEDAMQSFRNRAISDQAFAYLLCNVMSTIERILFLRHCFYNLLYCSSNTGQKSRINERSRSNVVFMQWEKWYFSNYSKVSDLYRSIFSYTNKKSWIVESKIKFIPWFIGKQYRFIFIVLRFRTLLTYARFSLVGATNQIVKGQPFLWFEKGAFFIFSSPGVIPQLKWLDNCCQPS